jgi:glyoxylate/hydroxypyruvate reductase A
MAFLFHSQYFDPEDWRKALQREDPDIDFRTLATLGNPDEIDCVMAWKPPPGTFARLRNVKLIYATGVGVDGLLADPDRPRGIPVARVSDRHQAQDMANFVLGAVLRHHLRFDQYARQQADRTWHIPRHISTAERRIGVMGLGSLGKPTAETLASVGFSVSGWTRAKRVDAKSVPCFVGENEQHDFLRQADILACMLPLTPQTRGIINTKLLSQLPKGAAIINVGRGPHIVEEDLLSALKSHLSGATLDVFDQEPLPADHPYWRHPKIFVTPHVATIVNPSTAASQVAENLRRLRTGQPLINLVDETRGY